MSKITREDYLYKAMIMLNERVFIPAGHKINIDITKVFNSDKLGATSSI